MRSVVVTSKVHSDVSATVPKVTGCSKRNTKSGRRDTIVDAAKNDRLLIVALFAATVDRQSRGTPSRNRCLLYTHLSFELASRVAVALGHRAADPAAVAAGQGNLALAFIVADCALVKRVRTCRVERIVGSALDVVRANATVETVHVDRLAVGRSVGRSRADEDVSVGDRAAEDVRLRPGLLVASQDLERGQTFERGKTAAESCAKRKLQATTAKPQLQNDNCNTTIATQQLQNGN